MMSLREIAMFGICGVIGYAVDVGVLHVTAPALGPYGGRALSYLAAATTTFLLNRSLTFRVRERAGFLRQWALFLIANLGGGAVNFGVYAGVVAANVWPLSLPWAAVAAGSLAGAAVNFTLAKRVVFTPRRPID